MMTQTAESADRTRAIAFRVMRYAALAFLLIWPWYKGTFVPLAYADLAIVYTIVAASLVMLTGWVGQISLAQAGFVGIGAFVTAMAAESLHEFPLPQVLSLGIYEQRNGHVLSAIELYQKVVRGTADRQLRAEAWSQIGSAYTQLKNYDEAKRAYENALQLRPDNAASLLGSGLLAERSGNASQAVIQLSHAVKVEPSDVGFLLLADALRREQRRPEAQAAEELAERISPDLNRAREGARQTEIFFGCALPGNASATPTR